jgi:hypothetical protein
LRFAHRGRVVSGCTEVSASIPRATEVVARLSSVAGQRTGCWESREAVQRLKAMLSWSTAVAAPRVGSLSLSASASCGLYIRSRCTDLSVHNIGERLLLSNIPHPLFTDCHREAIVKRPRLTESEREALSQMSLKRIAMPDRDRRNAGSADSGRAPVEDGRGQRAASDQGIRAK